jgi:glycosyltransferase involved in cell wall biosynthesis
MKVLDILPKLPWPAVDGASIAVHSQLEGLRRCGVDWVTASFLSNRHQQDWEGFHSQFKAYAVDGMFPEMEWKSALASLFHSLPYNLSLRFDRQTFRDLLKGIQADHPKFDLIQIEWVNMGLYLDLVRDLWPGTPVVLRQHNVEHLLLARMADRQTDPLRRVFARLQASRMMRFEQRLLPRMDHVIALTDDDRDRFRALCPGLSCTTLPVGIDLKRYRRPERLRRDPCFLIIGSLSWEPYAESVRWFIREVWTPYHRGHPDMRLTMIGASPPDDLMAMDGSLGLQITGFVEDVLPYFHSSAAMLLPLNSGSGMRVKAIEAAASHLPILSSPIGVEGLPFLDGRDCLIASTPQAWWSAMDRIIAPDLASILSANAYSVAATWYSVEAVSSATMDLFQMLVSERRR